MAKFTFGAGNARALLRAPIYLAGAIASRIVRRDDRLWVFGSGIGLGEGALELHARARASLPGTRLVWLCSSDEELAQAQAAGMTAALKSGWRGFRLTLRARVVVVTHGFGDVNRYAVPGAFVVQLWHGIPLKKLHLDSPAALRLRPLPDHPLVRRLLSSLYRRAARQISLFPAASAVSAARLASAFGLAPTVTAVTGDPRDDVLLRGPSPDHARRLLEQAVGPLPAKVLLYAPTWRDGAADPGVPSASEWESIARWLERDDAALLVRPHPLGVGDYLAGVETSPRVRMLDPSVLREVMPALPAVDVLVTDYSSIAYDFSLLEREIVFFAPDLDRYASSRGLYEPYRDVTGGTHVATWHDVLARLDAPRGDAPASLAGRLRDEHFDFVDAGAADRVLAEIAARLGAEGVPTAGTAQPRREISRIEIDSVRLDDLDTYTASVVLGGPASSGLPTTARLTGARLQLPGTVVLEGARWTITVPLLVSRWGAPALAPPAGRYRLQVGVGPAPDADGSAPPDGVSLGTTRVDVTAALPDPALNGMFRVSFSADGTLDLAFGPPLTAEESGRDAQRALERRYRRDRPTPERAVFFESFYSRVAACNPRAIDARLAEVRPDVVRYWSTVDASVAIPDGAVRVVEGSADWWRARANSRLLVVNDWVRKRYRRRPHQKLFQTWHGTMLKRLALDRDGISARTRLAVVRESSRWDFLLAQNPHSSHIFRSAYRFRGAIWQEGYPRDDALASSDGAAIRARLGISQGVRTVLYAPTWRDDRADMVDYLELESFAAALNHATETVVLVRGHSRTIPHGRDLEGAHVLDVTTYPDITDLLLVADVLITDYSSLMFDFTATGKPIIFFTPDIRHYSEDLRGFYFDLHAEAPGPVVESEADLLDAVRSAEAEAPEHAERYAAWRARFNPLDDGHAAERVVRRIVDAGLLD